MRWPGHRCAILLNRQVDGFVVGVGDRDAVLARGHQLDSHAIRVDVRRVLIQLRQAVADRNEGEGDVLAERYALVSGELNCRVVRSLGAAVRRLGNGRAVADGIMRLIELADHGVPAFEIGDPCHTLGAVVDDGWSLQRMAAIYA